MVLDGIERSMLQYTGMVAALTAGQSRVCENTSSFRARHVGPLRHCPLWLSEVRAD